VLLERETDKGHAEVPTVMRHDSEETDRAGLPLRGREVSRDRLEVEKSTREGL